ncbi:MAG: class I tRNA ligase family protein, partial [bacterium]
GGGAAHDADRWILSLYGRTIRDVTAALERFDLAAAVRTLYNFFWGEYCDWYLELVKGRLSDAAAQSVSVHVLGGTIKLLHTFMPFITSEIWEKMGGESIARASWPGGADLQVGPPWDEAAVES